MSASGGNKAVVAALSANLVIAFLKFLAFALTRSSSMLAEAIHSVADSGNQVLLLVGGKRAARRASPEHPFGYGRERYIYAFIVSIVLFSVGGLFALYEAYSKWQDPHPIEGQWWWVPLAVLVGAILAEGFSFRTAMRESNRTRGKKSWIDFVRTAKAPELPVLLLEDFGALLAVETKSLLLGESATASDVRRIEEAITADGTRIIHLKTLHLGPEELLVAAKMSVDKCETGEHIAEAINGAESRIREAVPIARVIYLEPDVYVQPQPQQAAGDPSGPAGR